MKFSTSPFSLIAIFVGILFTGCIAPPGGRPTQNQLIRPPKEMPDAPVPPAHGAFETGRYRNLFAERGLKPKDIEARVTGAYEQLFHGRPNDQAVMFPAGQNEHGPLAYIKDIGNNDVRSEGMSYGMMIAVQMNRQDDFDAIWNWAYSYMYHRDKTHPDHGYFSWQLNTDGTAIDENPAPDGEEYFVTALFFAAHRWGSKNGVYNYKKHARTILSDMKNRADISGTVNGKDQTTITSLFHPDTAMVRFTPNVANFASNGDHTDPSYHLPAFYELWARWGDNADRSFWEKAAQVSRDFFVTCTHPKTALNPDYANFDGTPKAASWDGKTVDFRYDAFRTAMNWAMDYSWWAKDKREIELTNRLHKFFEQQGVYQYAATYTLDGQPTAQHRSAALVAMNAAAAMAASEKRAWQFVDELWITPVPTGKWRYYDGLLHMFALLHLSGNYQIYMP